MKVWDAVTGQELLALKGHSSYVNGVCFSPDGTRLASASGDETVKVWDASTGQELLTLNGHSNDVMGVCFSPDGTRIASASGDETVKVWDASTGQMLFTFEGHTECVWTVSFSPDGMRLTSVSWDEWGGKLKLWDAFTGFELLTLEAFGGQSSSFSPDGRQLAYVHDTVKVCNVATGEETLTLKGHSGVSYVCFSPDGTRLASGNDDGTVNVWDASTSRELLEIDAHTGYVNGVCFSPDGTRLASAGEDGTVKVWG